jgi:hypothetical protein
MKVPVKPQHHQALGGRRSRCFYLALVFVVLSFFVLAPDTGISSFQNFPTASCCTFVVPTSSCEFSDRSNAPWREEVGMRRALVRAHPGPIEEPSKRLLGPGGAPGDRIGGASSQALARGDGSLRPQARYRASRCPWSCILPSPPQRSPCDQATRDAPPIEARMVIRPPSPPRPRAARRRRSCRPATSRA